MKQGNQKTFEKLKKVVDKPNQIWYNKCVNKKGVVNMATKTALQNSLRKRYMDMVTEFLISKEEEVLQVASNEIALPCVDDEGNDEFIVLTFKIPKGTRGGEVYDGYEMAEDYELKSKVKAEKQKKAQAEKTAKIERDKALREKKAKAKAERESA